MTENITAFLGIFFLSMIPHVAAYSKASSPSSSLIMKIGLEKLKAYA